MSFRHLVNAANAASFGWQLSGSRTYLAAQVPALIVAPVPAIWGSLDLASVSTSRMVWQGLATGEPSAKLLDMKGVQYRSAGPLDFTFLATMLGEAAVWRPDKPTPTADQVLADPRYSMYFAGWPRPGDHGLIAEHDTLVGAAWYRTYTEASHGYGFVAEDIPELSIAVIASRRHEGIGRRLLVDLINASDSQGYPALSLSVAEANPARRLYESVGFVPVEKYGSSWTMVRYAVRSQ